MEIGSKITLKDEEIKEIKVKLLKFFKSPPSELNFFQKSMIKKLGKLLYELKFTIVKNGDKIVLNSIFYNKEKEEIFKRSYDFIKMAKENGYLNKQNEKDFFEKLPQIQDGLQQEISITINE